MTAKEITTAAIAEGLLSTTGQTPSQTMKAKLSVNILQSGIRSVFMRSEAGRFALREWNEIKEHVADRYQKVLFDEDIVVFPEELRTQYVPRIGLNPTPLNAEGLLAECFPMRRSTAESEISVIQLVSVFIVKHDGRLLTFKRSRRLPESRLHGFYSVAFGGHLNPDDVLHLFNIFDPEQSAAWLTRELDEELRIVQTKNRITRFDYVGLLYDDAQPVSRQHLGLVYEVELSTREYEIGERGFLMDSKFETVEEIMARLPEFENWSAILVDFEAQR